MSVALRPRGAPIARLAPTPATGTDGGYPWHDGELLYAGDLNAAIAGSVQSLHLEAFVAPGDSDDTAALNRMIAAWSASPGGGAMLFPIHRETRLSAGVTINIAQGQSLLLGAEDNGDARLRFATTLSGTAFTIIEAGSISAAEGPLVRIQNLTFISTWATVACQGFSITAGPSGNVAPSPSCYISEIRFQNDGGGSWLQGGSLFAMNVTRVRSFTCFSFLGNSIGLSYDTDTRISVEHDIEDFYFNGNNGGTGLMLGHSGATGPLQGFTIRRPSFTNATNGIVATCANNLDQIIVTQAQISVSGTGISLTNVTTPIIADNYFLTCGTAIHVTGGTRHSITGNVFDLGPPTATPGDGTNNLGVVISNTSGAPDAGSVVSGNLFTNVYGSIACVQITGSSTSYVHCTNNIALEGTVVSDTTGNSGNSDFGNYSAGGIQTIYLGTGTPATKPSIGVSTGNLAITPPPGGGVVIPGALGIETPTASTSSYLRTETAGDLLVNTYSLKLAQRIGQPGDAPALAFAYNTTGTAAPQLGYDPSTKQFVFSNENAAAMSTIDVSGNISGYGGFIVGSGGPTITSGAGVPSATQPSGSIYLRTSGAAGARLYVSAGGGTWAAVAGV